MTFKASHQAPWLFRVETSVPVAQRHTPSTMQRLALKFHNYFKERWDFWEHMVWQGPNTQLESVEQTAISVCHFSTLIILSAADELDISVSGTNLGRRQPLCLQCKIGIIDNETFGPLASPWLCPHAQRNKNTLCPRNAIWNGAVSPAAIPPLVLAAVKESETTAARLSVRKNPAKFQLPLC